MTVADSQQPLPLGRPAGSDALVGDRDGETYDRTEDFARLNAQHLRVYAVMQDGRWHTLKAIADRTGDPESSISARLRDFRKDRFGGHRLDRQRRSGGLWEYRLEWNTLRHRPAPQDIRDAFDR